MTETPDDTTVVEFEEPAPETRRTVELCIAHLRADPRTSDVVTAMEQALPMLAPAYGIDLARFPVWDLFQGMADAWMAAQTRAWHESAGADPFDPATVPAS